MSFSIAHASEGHLLTWQEALVLEVYSKHKIILSVNHEAHVWY